MTGKLEVSYEFVTRAMNQPGVLQGLRGTAERIRKRAQGMADAEGVDMKVTIEEGKRPGGRPYVDVVGDNAEQEYGSSKVQKLRILGRAGEQG